MATPTSEVGLALAEIKARTGFTWAEVGKLVGTTGEYARKLATKPTSAGAGKALASNVRDFHRTGATQKPVQRQQAVRVKGGGTAPAAPRLAPRKGETFYVKRNVFKGTKRDGWAVRVGVPSRKTKEGDKEDARHAITAAVRKAAQGRRRVAFRVTIKDPTDPSGRRTVELGGHGGYNASSVLKAIKAEGLDPLAWFLSQDLDRYREAPRVDDEEWDEDEDADELEDDYAGETRESDILAVEIIGLP